LWLQSGDENKTNLQAYAKGRKMEKKNWSLKDSTSREYSSFDELMQLGTCHLKNLFKSDGRVTIDAIVWMTLFSPMFVDKQDNMELIKEVTEEEIKHVLHSFQKDKIHGPDGWSMDFFVGIYDLIRKDILRVVEESHINDFIHSLLNATLISLNPKKDDPQSLEDFRPISLCNNIYKVVSNIINRRLNPFLSKLVSEEQFGFLEGRQIHEAIGVAHEALHSIKY